MTNRVRSGRLPKMANPMFEKPTEELPESLITETDGEGALSISAGDLGDIVEYSVEVSSEAHKHDVTLLTAVLMYKGDFYMFGYFRSYNHGVTEDAGNWGDITLAKVKAVEITKTQWEVVTDG